MTLPISHSNGICKTCLLCSKFACKPYLRQTLSFCCLVHLFGGKVKRLHLLEGTYCLSNCGKIAPFNVGDLGSNPTTLQVIPPVGVLRQDPLTPPAHLGYECKSLCIKASVKGIKFIYDCYLLRKLLKVHLC